jgi:bacterioferritin-associated ferredoxin
LITSINVWIAFLSWESLQFNLQLSFAKAAFECFSIVLLVVIIMKIKVELDDRDFLEVETDGSGLNVSMLGCTEFMEMMQKMKRHFGVDIRKWPLPEGTDHPSILLREMVLKLRGEWVFPISENLVCKCRSISARVIDQVVIAGAHTTDSVTKQTSASSACGTCRPDVQKIIDYRIHTKLG